MRGEEVPFINRELDKAKAVIEAWNRESTTLKGTNIKFYPVVDTSKVTSMANAFLNMSNIYSVGLLDTRKVTTMKNMFSGCTNLVTIPAFDVKEVTDMSYMF
jgi:surface protein